MQCDEIKPVCSNCRRRYVNIQSCNWGTKSPGKVSHVSGQFAPNEFSESPVVHAPSEHTSNVARIRLMNFHPSSIASTSRWRSLELRLMYHYGSVVSFTMPGCNGASKEAWQRTIPQLSFESELLLNPMLALSALHLHAHSGNNSEMGLALRRYLDRSLAKHRQALSNPDKRLKEQLWLSSVLLSHMYWLLAHQPQPNEPYEFPLQALRMLEGAKVIFKENNAFLGQQGYGWLGDETLPPVVAEDELSDASRTQLRGLEDDLSALMDAFEVLSMTDDRKNVYLEAKEYVLYHYRAFFSGADTKTLQRFAGFMAVRCQAGYLNMLKQHDPLAMALMARMLVLLSALDYAWWIHGKGDYEAIDRDIRGIDEILPSNLRWIMDWPRRVLNKDIILSRD